MGRRLISSWPKRIGLLCLLMLGILFVIHTTYPHSRRRAWEKLTSCSMHDYHRTEMDLSPWSAWKRVAGRDLFLFSSFYDDRMEKYGPIIRTLGVSPDTCPVYCLVTYNNSKSVCLPKPALVQEIDDHPHEDHSHGAFFYMCQLPDQSVPSHVSFSSYADCQLNSDFLPVQYNKSQELKQFTLCVSPLYNYKDASQLVEAIELNRMLGAEYVVLYNQSISYEVHRIIAHYVEVGLVKVIDWHLPEELDLFYYGQNLALNDCLYRNMYSAEYLVFLDLDEFIIPRKHGRWIDMMYPVLRKNAAGYLVRNVFATEAPWANHPMRLRGSPAEEALKPRTLTHNVRTIEVFPARKRSKYILQPKNVEQLGVHYIFRMLPGAREYALDPEVALLYHMKSLPVIKNMPEKLSFTHDSTLRKFGAKIASNMRVMLEIYSLEEKEKE